MDVKLPKLGEGADSGVVVNVFVKAGDSIVLDQAIIELENEKAVASIPATAAGRVGQVFVKVGDKVSVGQRILSLETHVEEKPSAVKDTTTPVEPGTLTAPAESEHAAADDVAEQQPATSPAASPSLRRILRELGIDPGKLRGSGPGGRVEMRDLRAYIQRLEKQAGASGAALGPVAPVNKPRVEAIDFSKWGPISRKPLTPLRQVVARRMWENWNAIPHVTQFDEAGFTRLNELRKQYAAAYKAKGSKLTLTPLVLKAVAATLKRHPVFNSSLDEVAMEIILKDYIHLGVAVDTDAGLIVPVIRDVDKKRVLDLAKELEVLAQKARDRKVSSEELKGGTFTISNQGAIGGAHFTPIINKPEVAILGLGRAVMKPVVRNGKVEARMMTPLGLSYDHRVIDGAAAARFMVDLVKTLENFSEECVHL